MSDATLKIDLEPQFGLPSGTSDSSSSSCPSTLLEITEGPYAQGQEITIKAWGDDINGLTLYVGSESLGRGTAESTTQAEQDTIETIEFQAANVGQLEYPIDNIVKITAQTAIIEKSVDGTLITYAPAGGVLSFGKIGGSCVGVVTDGEVYYGTIKVHYNKARYYRQWTYTLPNENGTFYFFVKDGSEIVADFTVEITGVSGTEAGFRDVTLVYTDYVSSIPVVGAAVIFDNGQPTVKNGVTDVNGKVTFLTVATGTHYIKATKSGYLDTDADDIDNDSILVT